MLYEEGILSVVLRTVISCGRDEYGAVEKTLKGIFTVCTLLVFPVVVALWWTIYKGVKRFRYDGSVVPAMLSASGIRVFTTKLRGLLHQSESTQYGEPGYYISYSYKKAIKVICGVWASC